MRKVERPEHCEFPKSRKTEFTKEEMLDILDFYLQYKPLLEEYLINKEESILFNPTDFSILLFVYGIFDIDYVDNVERIIEKYGKTKLVDVSKEKLDFLEIITVFTYITRASRNDIYIDDYCIENNVYYNLLCRLEEIKKEIEIG